MRCGRRWGCEDGGQRIPQGLKPHPNGMAPRLVPIHGTAEAVHLQDQRAVVFRSLQVSVSRDQQVVRFQCGFGFAFDSLNACVVFPVGLLWGWLSWRWWL